MKKLTMFVGSLAVIVLTAGHGLAQHYYGGGNIIPLKVDSTKVTIMFDVGFDNNAWQVLLATIDRKALQPSAAMATYRYKTEVLK